MAGGPTPYGIKREQLWGIGLDEIIMREEYNIGHSLKYFL